MMTMTSNPVTINGVTLTGHHVPRQNSVLTPDALGFLAALHREFEPRRRELLAEVWGYRDEVSSRTVDTHVAVLRRKLGHLMEEPGFIMTVAKTGYRLRE